MRPEIVWSSIDFGLERGLEDMLTLDWEEVENGRDDTPLAINWPHYRRLEREGVLRPAYMLAGGKLIGANIWFVHCPPHHSLTKWAVNDLIYLDPEHRRGFNGVRLISECESPLRDLGVKLILYTVKLHRRLGPESNRGSVGMLLRRLGYEPFEESFAKRL